LAKILKNYSDFLSPISRDTKDLLDSSIIKRLEKERRGQGYGKDYKSFLTVRDVPSHGRSHRRPAKTHGRMVNLLSDLELAAFLLYDWNDSVIDCFPSTHFGQHTNFS
jgi:hypothetical protein